MHTVQQAKLWGYRASSLVRGTQPLSMQCSHHLPRLTSEPWTSVTQATLSHASLIPSLAPSLPHSHSPTHSLPQSLAHSTHRDSGTRVGGTRDALRRLGGDSLQHRAHVRLQGEGPGSGHVAAGRKPGCGMCTLCSRCSLTSSHGLYVSLRRYAM